MISQHKVTTLKIISQIITAQDQLQSAIEKAQEIIKITPDLYPVAEDVRIDMETALEAIQDAEISSNRLFNNINGGRHDH